MERVTTGASRVAALYDIHGNIAALDAVLAEIRSAGIDRVVVGGDVVPGPMPAQTLRVLRDLDVPVQFIRGNGERAVLDQRTGSELVDVPERYRDVIRWTANALRADEEKFIAAWPATCRVAVHGLGDVLFCHATPRNDMDIFTRLTAEERLLPIFSEVGVPVVVCGHTHVPFDRTIGGVRVVNAGSVGMPFTQPRGAYWLMLGPDIGLRRTEYDFAAAAAKMRETGFPQVEELAVRYVLEPPTEAETLSRYARTELG